MIKEKIMLGELKLIGISKIISKPKKPLWNDNEKEKLLAKFLNENISGAIKNRCQPGVTYFVYTNYHNATHAAQKMFVGEAVSSINNHDSHILSQLTIPESQYQKFTTEPGVFPEIIEYSWEKLCQLNLNHLQGKRTYHTDFEVYDHRAINPGFSIVDIYLGIQ